MNMGLEGKVVLITGAAGGIGAAIACAFAEKGACELVLLDIDGPGLATLAARLPVPVRTAIVDLRREQDIVQVVQEVAGTRVDILISNAGVIFPGKFLDLSPEVWEESWRSNLLSHVSLIRTVVPLMGEGGAIVITGSDQGLQPDAGLSAYSTAKAALHALTKSLAQEWGPDIRINAIAPGMTHTPLVDQMFSTQAKKDGTDVQTAERKELERRGLPRLLEPEEVAREVVHLATSANTGSIHNFSLGNVKGVMS